LWGGRKTTHTHDFHKWNYSAETVDIPLYGLRKLLAYHFVATHHNTVAMVLGLICSTI
jgi:hypothetical protein